MCCWLQNRCRCLDFAAGKLSYIKIFVQLALDLSKNTSFCQCYTPFRRLYRSHLACGNSTNSKYFLSVTAPYTTIFSLIESARKAIALLKRAILMTSALNELFSVCIRLYYCSKSTIRAGALFIFLLPNFVNKFELKWNVKRCARTNFVLKLKIK